MTRLNDFLLAAAMLAAAATNAAAQTPPAKPLAWSIEAAPAPGATFAPFTFNGMKVNDEKSGLAGVNRMGAVGLPGKLTDPVTFAVKITPAGKPLKVRIAGKVTDYLDGDVATIDQLADLKGDAEHVASFQVTPKSDQSGPFYFVGTWKIEASELVEGQPASGDLALVVGRPNWQLVLEDFEAVAYPHPGKPIESSVAAKHRGERGLVARLPAPAKDQKSTLVVPMRRKLPGRAASIGLWVKSAAPVELSVDVADKGISAFQGTHSDKWIIGPVAVEAGDWRLVEFPLPAFGRPKSKVDPHGEFDGIVDYPLTVNDLKISAAGACEVLLDDLLVRSQGEVDGSLVVRCASDKPNSLLYRTDKLQVTLANAWLAAPTSAEYKLGLVDIDGVERPLTAGKVTIAPGEETTTAVDVKDLPIGVYRLTAQVTGDLGQKATLEASRTQVIVYEPSGQRLSHTELADLLGNRHKLLRTLGFDSDQFLLPWHSVDGHPAIERSPGLWTFDWIDSEINGRAEAGLDVAAILGFCPLWASDDSSFNRRLGVWLGSTVTIPARSIYWEEYVRRTARHYNGKISTWLVWDRPDAEDFGATAQVYAERLVESASKAIRAINPQAKIVSGGVARENLEKFMIGLAEGGAGNHLDGIGVFPSTAPLSPEDGYLDVTLARAQRLREREGIKPPLWVLDLGWPTGDQEFRVSEDDQARFLSRAYVLCRAEGIDNVLLRYDATENISKRDSADLVYQDGLLYALKPAALSGATVRAALAGAEFVGDVSLADRRPGLSRAYLFRHSDGKLTLAAWRCEGSCNVTLPVLPQSATDMFGNSIAVDGGRLALGPALKYITFAAGDPKALVRQLSRSPVAYEDDPASQWKQKFTFHLNVGDPDDERAADYEATDSELIPPIDSFYHNDYGQHVVDSGRLVKGEERFVVDVKDFGSADLVLYKRIDYGHANQRVKVLCNDQPAGQWYAFKRDRRFRWRDVVFVVPNKLFAGKDKATLRIVTQGKEPVSSFAYLAGPLTSKTMFVSDLPLLVETSGYGAGVNRDKNILGGEIKFFKSEDRTFGKGIGTNAAGALTESLLVIPLNQQFKRFKATVGIDAATGGEGTVRFRIGDGTKLLWDSKDMTYYSQPQDIDLDVSNSVVLLLWADDTGDGKRNDLANWAEARLELK